MTALALAKMGQAQLIPAYMVSVSNFIILVFTVLRSNGILFGCRDYEMLSSLPVQAKEIISRMKRGSQENGRKPFQLYICIS